MAQQESQRVRAQDVEDAIGVIEYLAQDLIVAHRLYEFFQSLKPPVVVLPETDTAVRRVLVSYIILALDKFSEFYDRYKWILPESCAARCLALKKLLDGRNIGALRNTFVGHILNNNTNRPISGAEVDAAFNRATGDDIPAFLTWIHKSGPDVAPDTVVGLIQTVQLELHKSRAAR